MFQTYSNIGCCHCGSICVASRRTSFHFSLRLSLFLHCIIGAMAALASGFTYGQWSLVYNSLSFGIAGMGSATIFFWLQLANVTKNIQVRQLSRMQLHRKKKIRLHTFSFQSG